jgi:hypothetical protein
VLRREAAKSEKVSATPNRFVHDFTSVPARAAVRDVTASSGQPLDPATRAWFEPRLGRDLSDIRLHADAVADLASRSVDAGAFTFGRDIAFRRGAYDPSSGDGRRLLAHELTHAVQQGESRGSGEPVLGRVDDPVEREADRAAEALVSGAHATVQRHVHGGVVRRDPPAAPPTEREKIDKALASRNPADVVSILDFSSATEAEQITLIEILLYQAGTGAQDKTKLEQLWTSVTAGWTTDLLSRIAAKKTIWDDSIAAGAVLSPLLDPVRTEKTALETDAAPGSGKSLGEVGSSIAKLKDVSHDLAVIETGTGLYEGSRCTTSTAGTIRMGCDSFVEKVLEEAFTQQGRAKDWKKVMAKAKKNEASRKTKKGSSGIDVQAALQSEAGWKGILWAPDPKYKIPDAELSGAKGDEASWAAKRKVLKYGFKDFPGVKVHHKVTDYAPEAPNPGHGPASTTVKDTTQLDKLKKLPLGYLTAHGGYHTAIFSYGKVIELHWTAAADSVDVITQTDLETWAVGPTSGFHYYASGVIVAPAADVDAAFK